MNRIPKAGYTKEFCDEAVKLAMTDGVGVSRLRVGCGYQ